MLLLRYMLLLTFPDVHENIKTIEKRLSLAGGELAASNVVVPPDVRNEEGLPVTEIREELDDEGNVLCMCFPRLLMADHTHTRS